MDKSVNTCVNNDTEIASLKTAFFVLLFRVCSHLAGLLRRYHKRELCFALLTIFLISLSIPSESAHAQVPAAPPSNSLPPPPPGTSNTSPTNYETEKETLEITTEVAAKFLNLYIGIEAEEKVPNAPEGAKIRGDFATVARVRIENGSLRITPTKEGVATAIITSASGKKLYEFRLDVKNSNLTKVAREIQTLLSNIEGITIKIIANRVVVDGQVLIPKDINRIHGVLKQYPGLVGSLVILSPVAKKKIAQLIQDEIHSPSITCRVVNDKFLLEGVAQDQAEMNRAVNVAESFLPEIVPLEAVKDNVIAAYKAQPIINLMSLKPAEQPPAKKMIQVTLHFVELKKDYGKQFRFQWMPDMEEASSVKFTNDSQTQGGMITTITGTIKNLLPKLNWAKSHGHGRMLETANLIITDGEQGSLNSTINVPYQTTVDGKPVVQTTATGLKSTVTPQIINPRTNLIRLNLQLSVSEPAPGGSGAPATNQHEVNTKIEIRDGESAAIAGLISSLALTNYNKLPEGGSKNPIFSLYASKDFARNQSQFVFFATPIIKSSASQGAERVKRKFRLRD